MLATGQIQIGLPGMMHPLRRSVVTADGTLWSTTTDLAGRCRAHLRSGATSPMLSVWAWDIADVPQPDRMRAMVHLRGKVRLVTNRVSCSLAEYWNQDVACFTPRSVVFNTYVPGSGFAHKHVVALPTYRAASPDTWAKNEGEWLRRLDKKHSAELRDIVQQHTTLGITDTVKPLALTQRAITCRIYRSTHVEDITVPREQLHHLTEHMTQS